MYYIPYNMFENVCFFTFDGANLRFHSAHRKIESKKSRVAQDISGSKQKPELNLKVKQHQAEKFIIRK